jgi:DNA polymerase-3 subunit gamma/tau
MIVIRLLYASDLPDPVDLIRESQKSDHVSGHASGRAPPHVSHSASSGATVNVASRISGVNALAVEASVQRGPQSVANNNLQTLEDVVALFEQNGALILASQIYEFVGLVRLSDLILEFAPAPSAPPRLAQEISAKLQEFTGQRWMVSISSKPAQAPLAVKAFERQQQKILTIKKDPLVAKVFEIFPEAQIQSIETIIDKKGN